MSFTGGGRRLKIGGGNLLRSKGVFCIFRCQSIWVRISEIIWVPFTKDLLSLGVLVRALQSSLISPPWLQVPSLSLRFLNLPPWSSDALPFDVDSTAANFVEDDDDIFVVDNGDKIRGQRCRRVCLTHPDAECWVGECGRRVWCSHWFAWQCPWHARRRLWWGLWFCHQK